ncbi:MAG TPA: DUF5362 family protein [Puia sp.]|nr:DUF5362 family protein [Puia sp.]
MEQNSSPSNLFELHIDNQSSGYLAEAARWAKFLAILGFIFCGLIVLVAVFAGSYIASSFNRFGTEGLTLVSGAFVSFLYILIALLYFFPCLFLFRFASKMQVALRTNDQELLNTSFRNLRGFYRFLGILTIVVLSIYVLALIFVIIGVAVSPH